MTGNKPFVLVTGANGFVGRHVAPELERHGWSVRRAVRKPEGRQDEVFIPTIGPGTNWDDAVAGADAVVHLAARVHHKHEEHALGLYRDVNISGTLHLARSAAEAGVRHFIFISTVLVHGRTNNGRGPFSETDVLTPRGLYGMSKAAAEEGLRKLATEYDMKISVIRPPLVYGAGARGNFALLSQAVKLGLPLPFGAIRNSRAFLCVQNLSSFVLRRLTTDNADSNFEVFLVADGEQVSTTDFIMKLGEAAGRRPRLMAIPQSIIGSIFSMLGQQDTYESLIGSLELNLSKAFATGWRPVVSLDEGLKLALAPVGA